MRIVHEVNGPMGASGGGDIGSGHVELRAYSDAHVNHPDLPEYLFGDDEVIEIEGEYEYVRAMLEAWMHALDAYKRAMDEKNLGVAQPG